MDNGLFEMKCTLDIAHNLLQQPITYRYVVHTPRMVNDDDSYEYVHSFSDCNPSRYLLINWADFDGMLLICMDIDCSSFTAGNHYHKYDFFVYPDASKERTRLINRTLEASRGFLNKLLPSWNLHPYSIEEMAKQCLLVYLEPMQNTLLNGSNLETVDDTVGQLKSIFQQHCKHVLQSGNIAYFDPVHCIKNVRL